MRIFFLFFLFFFNIVSVFGHDISILLYKGRYTVDLGGLNYITKNSELLYIYRISAVDGRIFVNDEPIERSMLVVKAKDHFNYLNGKQYRGVFKIYTDYFFLYIVNVVDVETYLRGVLPMEISPKWPLSAIEAQAIAARTFAYKKIEERGEKSYQLNATHYSQVYGGVDYEDARTDYAIRKTKNIVLTYDNQLITAFYHSSSGGRTALPSEVWGSNDKDYPYLKTIYDPFSLMHNDKWVFYLKKDKLTKILGAPIKALDLIYSESGRVKYIKFIDKYGGEKTISGNKFRLLVGSSKLRSTKFDARVSGDMIVFRGRGWGHGVGMAQWGAYFMAKKGYSYKEILKFYYKNIDFAMVGD